MFLRLPAYTTMRISVISFNGAPLPGPLGFDFDSRGGAIGREEGNELTLPDPERHISRVQARIEFDGANFVFVDMGGNPSSVNGRPVGKGNRVVLTGGERLSIGVLFEHSGQGPADVADQRRKTGLEGVVVVGRQRGRPALVADQGGELAGEGQELAEQAFGVELGELGEVVEHRLVAVDGEQEDEVGDLGDATGARLGQPRGQGFAPLPEEAADLAQEAGEARQARTGGM